MSIAKGVPLPTSGQSRFFIACGDAWVAQEIAKFEQLADNWEKAQIAEGVENPAKAFYDADYGAEEDRANPGTIEESEATKNRTSQGTTDWG